MARQIRTPRSLKPVHIFICEDTKSSKYYMEGLGKAKNINIKAEKAYGTSPEDVYETAKDKLSLFRDKGIAKIYCLFDKDDCPDDKFNKIIAQCRKKEIIPAFSIPCYEYWLLLHFRKTNQPFANAQECCETFKNEYNRCFGTNYEINTLKSRKDIFNDLKDKLDTAISNAERLNLNEKEEPYTNMHKIIKDIID